MTEQTDFLKHAIEAMKNSQHALIIASYEDMIDGADYQMRTAQTLALLCLAQDVRRVADVLASADGGAHNTCHWRQAPGDSCWSADCGLEWSLDDDGPAENGMSYCPNCGNKLVVEENS